MSFLAFDPPWTPDDKGGGRAAIVAIVLMLALQLALTSFPFSVGSSLDSRILESRV